MSDALQKCPSLFLVPSHHELYKKYSKKFISILKTYTSKVEQYSIDEAFMDLTGTEEFLGEPESFAYELKERIRRELGFTVNIGISTNKLLAKMASDFEKPDKVHTLFPWEIQKKMWPLPVSELLFVGASTEQTLKKLGIYTIGELARTDVEILKLHLKKQGETIWNYANGKAEDVVEEVRSEQKGYGSSTTLALDLTDREAAHQVLLSLCEGVGTRMRKDEIRGEVLSVTIKDSDFHSVSHQTVLPASTNITAELYRTACRLFDELWKGTPIRLLGVRVPKVTKEESVRQLSLFDHTDYDKLEKIDKAVDEIRKKFGSGAIMRASFLTPPEKEEPCTKRKDHGNE